MTEKELFDISEKEINVYRGNLAKALLSKPQANPKITIGETPAVLQYFHYEKLPLKTDKKTILKVMGEFADIEHNVSKETILNLPKLIKDPLGVIKSRTKENRLLLVLDCKDNSDRQIVLPIAPENREHTEDSHNFIPSFYGRNKFSKFMQTNFKSGNIVYIKEKNLETLGKLQLPPLGAFQGSVNIIAMKADIVKRYLAQKNQKSIEKERMFDLSM
jgi:hypothetical protein